MADAQCDPYGYESEIAPYNMDLDGTASTGVATYSWVQLSGETVTVNSPAAVVANFDAPGPPGSGEFLIADCTLVFQLTVDGGDTDTCSTYIRLPGDSNGDNVVNAFDLADVRNLVTPGADFNGDGGVNAFDLSILRRNSGRRRTS